MRVPAALGVALVLASCARSGGSSGARRPLPEAEATAAPDARTPSTYYAGVEGLKVYSEPSGSAKVVGALSLYEKVNRYKVKRGYAYVESSARDLKGWVSNAQLIWRLPTTAAPAPVEAEPEATPAPEFPPTTTTPVPAVPARSTTTLRGVPPSIFNPY